MSDTSEKIDLEHMTWLVKHRSANQECCLQLFELLEKHPEKWASTHFYTAQDLVGAAFSLWRAVFLGEKVGRKKIVYQHFRKFLASLIQDNAISFAQDKKSNEWTFNYYVENARYRLINLAEVWPKRVTKWEKNNKRSPQERWEYAHKLLSEAVHNFDRLLSKEP